MQLQVWWMGVVCEHLKVYLLHPIPTLKPSHQYWRLAWPICLMCAVLGRNADPYNVLFYFFFYTVYTFYKEKAFHVCYMGVITYYDTSISSGGFGGVGGWEFTTCETCNLRWHMTPASSKWTQLWSPKPAMLQSISLLSFPVHSVSSIKMGPSPWPKNAVRRACAPVTQQTLVLI